MVILIILIKMLISLTIMLSLAQAFQNPEMGPQAQGFLQVSCYSKSPKVGNPIASILKSNVKGIPALFGLNPVFNFMGFTVNP